MRRERLDGHFGDARAIAVTLHPDAVQPGLGADDADELAVLEQQSHAVVGRPPTGKLARRDRVQVGGPPVGLAVQMHRERSLEQAEPLHRRRPARRLRDPALEPAHRARAQAGEHRAPLPALPQDLVEPVCPPDGEHVAHRAAADVDDVLRQQVAAQVDRVGAEAKQREMHRLAGPVGERGMEARDLLAGVAARGREEADAGNGIAREAQDELVQRTTDGLHREAAAAHGEDRAQATASGDAAAPNQSGSMATSIASPSTDSTLYAARSLRDATTRARSVPMKWSATPSSAA